MGKPKPKSENVRKNNPSNNIKKEKIVQKRLKRKKRQQNRSSPEEDNDPILFESDNDAEEEEKPTTEDIQSLLEPYSKEQLITLLANAAFDDPSLLSYLLSVAEHDIAHRKIFVHGIAWDVTTESLLEAFRPYGPIVGCNVVVDKASGRNKGFGFVVFATRTGAVKALKTPQKKIGTRMVSCNLASSDSASSASSSTDLAQRRVYVGNVHAEVSPNKLKDFFATFGEIESGPIGFDTITGKSRGFAIFVYKTRDGATRALQEPYKMFEGHQLQCKLAIDHSQKGKFPAISMPPQNLPVVNQQQALTAVAEAQNAAMLGQNPAYNMLLAQNQLFTNAASNPTSFAAFNPAALATFNPTANLVTPQGHDFGGLGYGAPGYGAPGYGVGVGLGGYNMFGNYRTQESAGLSYGESQLGKSSILAPATGFFRGYPP